MKNLFILAYTTVLIALFVPHVLAQTGNPDLQAGSLTYSGPQVSQQTLTVNLTVTNIGSALSAGWRDDIMLSSNTSVSGVVGQWSDYQTHTLPTGSNYTHAFSFSLPSVPAGTYYLIGLVDSYGSIFESNESNNTTAAVPITIGNPDLQAGSLTYSGPQVSQQTLTVTLTSTNIGSALSAGWRDDIILSSNTSVSGVVGQWSDYQTHTLPTGSNYTHAFSFSLPSVPVGTYYLIGLVDSYGSIFESNESNNTTAAVPITIGNPDLQAGSLTYSGPQVSQQTLTVTLTSTNIGSALSAGWWDDIMLSSNTSVSGVVGQWSDYQTHTLPTGSNYTHAFSFSLPSVPAGTYYLIGLVDSYGSIFESNESNNTTAAVPITIGNPDLVVTDVQWTGVPVSGQTLSVSMVVSNAGVGLANYCSLIGNCWWQNSWVLSTNRSLSGAIGTASTANEGILYAGGSQTVIGVATLPSVPAGNYFLIGVADNLNLVYESNESNNALAIPITVGSTDLALTSFNIIGTPFAGSNLSLSFRIQNVATNSYSSYWYDSVMLSTNTTTNGQVTSWEFYGYHSLTNGGSYTQNQTVYFPGIAAGTNYYLIAQADNRNYVPELTKTNNSQVLQIFVTNRPPFIALTIPSNNVQQTSCIPLSFMFTASPQVTSYPITSVQFYDNQVLLGSKTNIPYKLQSPLFDHGDHQITAQAVDQYGLRATSQVTTVSVLWPSQTNVLRADLMGTNCVVCMTASGGSNYLIQTTTNLQAPVVWQPLATITNLLGGNVLVHTNQRTSSQLYYRTKLIP